MSTEPGPEAPQRSEVREHDGGGLDGADGAGPEDELESVELEEQPEDDDLDDDEDDDEAPSYRRFDCTGDADPAEAIEAARKAVGRGDCVVLPTDTVYGIGADAFSAEAVQGLLDAKDRGRDMPPPVLVGDASLIRALATDVPDQALELVEVHWPGPLTIVCRIQPSLRMDLGDTDGTIALRVPDHDLTREVLRRTGPLAVSSANISGNPAATTCDDAVEQLGNRVAVYLDGGPLGRQRDGVPVALPSTIVDFTRHDDGDVLRRGALDVATLRRTLPGLRDLEVAEPEPAPTTVEPGPEEQGPGDPLPAEVPPDEPPAAEPGPDEPQPDEPRVEPEPER